ncbi:MAG TPA: tetratricopeptide repeat protein [Candidatus Eremiobacteraceae bacterium]|nr:tetratricopeptide repeat protein [Candidatus Eremiobacteraceae bacterium]
MNALRIALALIVGVLVAITTAELASADTSPSSPCLSDDISKFHQGDFADIVVDCTAVIAQHPDDADAYLMRSKAYYFGGRLDAALADVDKAVDLAPKDPYNWSFRCQVKKQMGMFAAALDDCDHALDLDPALPEPYFARGTLYLNEHSFAKAVDDFTIYIDSNPNDADAHYNRAIAYEYLGECKNAIPDFTAELRIQGEEPDGLFHRGECEFKNGDMKASKVDLVEAAVLYKKAGNANGVDEVTNFMLQFGATNTPTPQPS